MGHATGTQTADQPDEMRPPDPRRRSAEPSASDCAAALERVTASPKFKAAPRLAAFLRFVVETALAGASDSIKAYTVAVGALGRTQNFDPATDASVRVEAGRLRRALARYYADGRDPVIIALPRGQYVPEFRWRDDRPGAESPPAATAADPANTAAIHMMTAALHHELQKQRLLMQRNLADLKTTVGTLRALVDESGNRAREGTRRRRTAGA